MGEVPVSIMYAPSHRARRVVIAILAFALAIGFALLATTAPADAKDEKNYQVTVDPDEVGGGSTHDFTVTFLNPTSNTSTQKAGTFSIDFGGSGFGVNSSATEIEDTLTASGGQDWDVISTSGGEIVVSAASGGERISVSQTVSFVVNATAPISPGLRTLATDGDQEDHGNFRGGNRFTLKGDPATINVVAVPTSCGSECPLGEPGVWNATLQCSVACSYLIQPDETGTFAVFDVFASEKDENGQLFIYILLETAGKGPSPGTAFVEVEGFGTLPVCGTNGPPNCVHIQRVAGNHTQYEVFWTEDPRFKFG